MPFSFVFKNDIRCTQLSSAPTMVKSIEVLLSNVCAQAERIDAATNFVGAVFSINDQRLEAGSPSYFFPEQFSVSCNANGHADGKGRLAGAAGRADHREFAPNKIEAVQPLAVRDVGKGNTRSTCPIGLT